MITLQTYGDSSVKFVFENSSHYLYGNGEIIVPLNSLILVEDSSDMITFKKIDGDVFVSATVAEFGMSKSDIEDWYKTNMVGSTGGGGGTTPEEVQEMIDESISGKADTTAVTAAISSATDDMATQTWVGQQGYITGVDLSDYATLEDIPDVSNYFDGAEYDSGTTRINFYHGNTVKAYIDASAFIVDGMIDNVSIETISGASYLVIDFNTASGKEDIQIPLTDIFDPSNYYSKNEVDGAISAATSGKADTTAVTASINAAVSGKVDTSTFETYSGSVETALSGKQDTLSAGTNITISGNVISAEGGGGKSIEAGRGISITTGETADTVSFNLPISAGTGENSIIEGVSTSAMSAYDHAEGYYTYANGRTYAAHAEGYQTSAMTAACHAEGRATTASGNDSHAEGFGTVASGNNSHAEGNRTEANSSYSHSEGYSTTASSVVNVSGIDIYMGHQARHAEGCNTLANNSSTHAEGYYTIANNFGEHASGVFNNSTSATTTWGNSGNTLFSVGNGTSNSARHNAFEIRQNGDIYLTSGGTDIKLQDNLGGTSYSAGTGIDITNDVISVSGVVMSSAVTTAVTSASTDSEIPSAKAVYDALGQGGGITSGDVQTLIDASISGKTDESAFTSFSGSVDARFAEDEEVTAAALNALNASLSGKLDTSAYTQVVTTSAVTSGSTAVIESGAVYNALGGLKLQKISQSDYDALVQGGTVDANTLYIITNVVS